MASLLPRETVLHSAKSVRYLKQLFGRLKQVPVENVGSICFVDVECVRTTSRNLASNVLTRDTLFNEQ